MGQSMEQYDFSNFLRDFVFTKSCLITFSNMIFSEPKFDRLDELFAKKPISQLIDDCMKPN